MNEETRGLAVASFVWIILGLIVFIGLLLSIRKDTGSYLSALAGMALVLWALGFGSVLFGMLLWEILPTWAQPLAILIGFISWPFGCMKIQELGIYLEDRARQGAQSA